MRAIVLISSAAAIWGWSAWGAAADQRVSLEGYQDFKFGTPEADLRTQIRVRKEMPNRSGGIYLQSSETVEIDGKEYWLGFVVKDGSLVQVELSRSMGGNTVACELQFVDMLTLLQAKYGPPDKRPDLNRTADVFFGIANFTFNDGGRIMAVGGADASGICDHTVEYISGQGKDTF